LTPLEVDQMEPWQVAVALGKGPRERLAAGAGFAMGPVGDGDARVPTMPGTTAPPGGTVTKPDSWNPVTDGQVRDRHRSEVAARLAAAQGRGT
jgi:hypothetical protein